MLYVTEFRRHRGSHPQLFDDHIRTFNASKGWVEGWFRYLHDFFLLIAFRTLFHYASD